MSTRRTEMVAIALFAASVVAAVAVCSSVGAAAPAKIRVGGRTEPMIIAQGKGWFEQEGLQVEVVDVRNFMQYPNLLASNGIDILDGYLPPNFWNMIVDGADFRIISGSTVAVAAQGGEPARNVRGYVVRKDLYDNGAVKTVKDLENHKVADFSPVPPKGQLSPFPIGHKIFGESFRRINWVRIADESEILKALERKDIDGARMRTRWVKLAVKQNLAVELAHETDFVPKIQVRALAAREAFLKANSDAVVRFLRVFLRAERYARQIQKGQHAEEYVAFVRKLSDIPPDIARDLIQEMAFTEELATQDLVDTQNHFVMMKSQQRIIPLEQIVDLSYLAAAKKGPGNP